MCEIMDHGFPNIQKKSKSIRNSPQIITDFFDEMAAGAA
jgi:hypothetical protein